MGSYLKCRDGVELFYIKNQPDKAIGIILINHGFAEHCSRYDHVAEKFAKDDFIVYRYDLRGHGRSRSPKGHIEDYMDFVYDTDEMINLIRDENPNLPIFMLGHSMGGFITCLYGIKYPDKLSGQIFSGAAVDRLAQVKGIKGDLLRILSLLMPRKMIKNKLSGDVCGLKEVVEEYENDPLVLSQASLNLYVQFLVRGIDWLQKNIQSYNYPCFISHGEKDIIVPKEVAVYLYNSISSKDKEIKIYDDLYHEILNDRDKDKVMWDMSNWIYNQLGIGSKTHIAKDNEI